MGKFLIITGLIIVAVGIVIHFSGKIPLLGKLPGDIRIEKGNFTLYFPIVSSILISILISLLLYFVNKGKS